MAQNTSTQAALQQILAKLDGIERTAVAQEQALSAIGDPGLRARRAAYSRKSP